MTMIPVDAMKLTPHKCMGCGRSDRAPFYDTLIDVGDFQADRLYICHGCVIEAVHQGKKKTGMVLYKADEVRALQTDLDETMRELERVTEMYDKLVASVGNIASATGGTISPLIASLLPQDLVLNDAS